MQASAADSSLVGKHQIIVNWSLTRRAPRVQLKLLIKVSVIFFIWLSLYNSVYLRLNFLQTNLAWLQEERG